MRHGNYRKYNDRTRNSRTYHKKDSENVRAKLKVEGAKEIEEDTVAVARR